MGVPLAGAAAVYSQRDTDLEEEEQKLDTLRAELTLEFESEKAKLLEDIESMLTQIEKLKAEISTLEDLNAQLERQAVAGSKDEQILLEKFEALQKEILSAEMRHQKQVKRLELENDELHTRLAKSRTNRVGGSGVETESNKISMVELYSSVLDALETSKNQLSYVEQPELPRVVVVGDQSSGKTSVLELVAKARIFPRGAGKMMTRSPVKVKFLFINQFPVSKKYFNFFIR